MSKTVVYSIVESPGHPDFSSLYRELGWEQVCLNSMRKAISQLRKQPPDLVVAEFFYGYGNNYAGINISNLDVFLHSLLKYAPQARVIVMVEKAERQYVDKLAALFQLEAILVQPVGEAQMREVLDQLVI
ncbi:hypothetical protein [Thiohalophilus thiocyanatoxydans]|uniref:Response regulatory domain-containing protein n=1 Tax=Thiohalophilus thiocyanatoxydans TaxID=381308 RepID=A0A4R8IJI8_9GAMM|nr:hypothetical protein [Thiohalophilus thiocyanatoxydans]TDY00508.1 hypothetical protein EDC23_2009 [Thiohalophilus thiocyanatoxydans]